MNHLGQPLARAGGGCDTADLAPSRILDMKHAMLISSGVGGSAYPSTDFFGKKFLISPNFHCGWMVVMASSSHVSRMLFIRGIALVHDTLMGAAALFLALVLRLDLGRVLSNLPEYSLATIIFGVVVGVVGFTLGMNRGVWRYASLPDLVAIIKAATISVAIFIVAHFLLVRLETIPRSSMIIAWAFLIVLLATPRAVYRVYRNWRDTRRARVRDGGSAKRVLLIGASDNTETFLKTIAERSGQSFDVLAIIDERGRRTGRFIRGVPVLGGMEKLPQIIRRFDRRGRRPEALILTRTREDYESHARIQDLIDIASEHRLEMLRLPKVLDLREVGAEVEVRPIKLEDLLQRKPLRLDVPKMATMIKGKKILITGAGGSIGSELVRQIVALEPASLILVDASEYLLYAIDGELRRGNPQYALYPLLCNVREKEAIARIIDTHRPDVIFHAAALKHVPIVEAQPLEGLFTNAIRTRNVAEAAVRAKVGAVVMVSTDKAVNPANVMGASKRLAEMFCQAMDILSLIHI